MELEGRVVVVVGGSRGIGAAVAGACVAHGAQVVVNGRDEEAVAAAVSELGGAEVGVSGVAGSASDPAVARRLREVAERDFGPVDVLLTCAGAPEAPGSSILDLPLEDWRGQLEAHLDTTLVACRELVPGMVERGRGAIVTTSSHAFTGRYGGTGYAAGKGGVNSLTYALAAELREHGVRVNAICPGARTRLSEGSTFEARIAELHERGLIDDGVRDASLAPDGPEHVAPLYVYLASDRARHLTGQVFAAAGGYLGRFAEPTEQLLTWRPTSEHGPYSLDELSGHLAPPSS